MRVNSVNNVNAISRQSDVQLRLDAVRNSLSKHGAAIIDTNNPTDQAVIEKLQNQFGESNVVLEQSSAAKLTVTNFKG